MGFDFWKVKNNYKGIISGEYGGWRIWRMLWLAKNCCTSCTEWAGVSSLWSCYSPTNSIKKTPQNITVVLPVWCMTRWKILMMNNALSVEENCQQCLHLASTHSCFFRSRSDWGLLLRKLILAFDVIAINPRFISGYKRFEKFSCLMIRRPHSTHSPSKHGYKKRKWARRYNVVCMRDDSFKINLYFTLHTLGLLP